jgi:Zn-dependent protease
MWLAGVFVFLGWILSVCLHEFGHAVVAYWGGDTSVKYKGYLTLNPLKYTDAEMSLILPILFLLMGGIAFPGGAVYIDRSRLRSRLWESAVCAAGPFANLLLTLLLAIPFWLGWASLDSGNWLWSSLAYLILLEIFAVFINLLPIPPLDGYGIIRPWLPQDIQSQFNKFGRYGNWFIFALLWSASSSGQFMSDFVNKTIGIIGVPLEAVQIGERLLDIPATRLVMLLGLIGVLLLKRKEVEVNTRKEVKWYKRGNHLRQAKQFFAKIISNRRQLLINPTLLVNWWQRFCEDVECAPLRRKLLNLVQNRWDTAERLIASAKRRNPGKSERWYLEKVIYDIQRDRLRR